MLCQLSSSGMRVERTVCVDVTGSGSRVERTVCVMMWWCYRKWIKSWENCVCYNVMMLQEVEPELRELNFEAFKMFCDNLIYTKKVNKYPWWIVMFTYQKGLWIHNFHSINNVFVFHKCQEGKDRVVVVNLLTVTTSQPRTLNTFRSSFYCFDKRSSPPGTITLWLRLADKSA